MTKEVVKHVELAPEFENLFEPTPRWVKQHLLEKLTLFSAVACPGKTPENIVIPDKLLSRQLTAIEKNRINSILSSSYAQQAVSAQKEIALVRVSESLEPMSNLIELFSYISDVSVVFSQNPYHPSCGEWAGKQRLFWVRQSFANLLIPYFRGLNSIGFVPKVEDAYRPPGVQEGLFKRRYQATKTEHPEWTHDQIIIEAMSKTAITPRLASHKAGAALDFMLLDRQHNYVDIGNFYPEGGAVVRVDCPYVTAHQWLHRQLFAQTAKMMGFSLYPWEDWHISYQDNLSGFDPDSLERRPGVTANYGPIVQFDLKSGTISQIYSEDMLDQTFPHI